MILADDTDYSDREYEDVFSFTAFPFPSVLATT